MPQDPRAGPALQFPLRQTADLRKEIIRQDGNVRLLRALQKTIATRPDAFWIACAMFPAVSYLRHAPGQIVGPPPATYRSCNRPEIDRRLVPLVEIQSHEGAECGPL